jgi:hypothetical protein
MSKLGRRVSANARKASRERKQQQRESFTEIYNRTKIFEFPEDVNMVKHFFCPKIFGPGGLGQEMNKAEMAVYPVLCSQANFERDDWFQLPQEHIAKMAGVSVEAVRHATRNLPDRQFEYIEKENPARTIPLAQGHKITEDARHFYIYKVGFIRRDMIEHCKGQYFIFYTHLIDSGIWAQLTLRAKCLYLALRNNAEQNIELYSEIEEMYYDMSSQEEWNNYYEERTWDACRVPIAELCRNVNIEHTNIASAIEQLEHFYLIERIDRFVKVYLKPWYRY